VNPTTSPPKPPTGLLKPSRDRWRAFWASPAASAINLDSDLPRLERWIQASDEYDRASKVVRQHPLVKGSMGQPVLNPLVAYMSQLEQTIRAAEDAFGMTPVARTKLKLDPEPPGEEDSLAKRRARRAAARGAAG
jgi:P27 family predicted phage terminase small subunit